MLDNVASGILLRVQMTLCQVNIQYSCNRKKLSAERRERDLPCIWTMRFPPPPPWCRRWRPRGRGGRTPWECSTCSYCSRWSPPVLRTPGLGWRDHAVWLLWRINKWSSTFITTWQSPPTPVTGFSGPSGRQWCSSCASPPPSACRSHSEAVWFLSGQSQCLYLI